MVKESVRNGLVNNNVAILFWDHATSLPNTLRLKYASVHRAHATHTHTHTHTHTYIHALGVLIGRHIKSNIILICYTIQHLNIKNNTYGLGESKRFHLKTWIRSLFVSLTNTGPSGLTATAYGSSNSPSFLPLVPNDFTYLPHSSNSDTRLE